MDMGVRDVIHYSAFCSSDPVRRVIIYGIEPKGSELLI